MSFKDIFLILLVTVVAPVVFIVIWENLAYFVHRAIKPALANHISKPQNIKIRATNISDVSAALANVFPEFDIRVSPSIKSGDIVLVLSPKRSK